MLRTIIFVALLSVSTGAQVTWWVHAASTAFPVGTQQNPFLTIYQAATVASVGDEIVVRPGTYYGSFPIAKALRIRSEAGPSTTIVTLCDLVPQPGTGTLVFDGFRISYGPIYTNGDVTIKNCEFDNIVSGIYNVGGPLRLERCRFLGCGQAIYASQFGFMTAAKCEFSGCGNPSTGTYVFSSGSSYAVFESCVFRNNLGITIDGSGPTALSGCTFSNNPIAYWGSGPGLVENTVFDQGTSLVNFDGPAVSVFNSLLPSTSSRVGQNGNVAGDPLFANPAAGDLTPLPGSPCINGGTNGALFLPSVDFLGNPRISGGTVDIGAIEGEVGLVHPVAAGTVGIASGGPFDVLFVNGSSGSNYGRRVDGIRPSIDTCYSPTV